MGRSRRKGRDVDGVLVLDKPSGMTSNAALQTIKHAFYARKAGHTGSLDPLATGVLPICFGQATRFSQYLLDSDKAYEATIRLGVSTDSGDSEGKVLQESNVPKIDGSRWERLLDKFRGEVEQVPNMFSAIKVDGQPLYRLARQGIEVDRAPRQVTIYSLVLRGCKDDQVQLGIRCSKGTYIRCLAQDIGEELGCGAHVTQLKRISSGPFDIDQAVSIDRIIDLAESRDFAALAEHLLPVSSAVSSLPAVTLPYLSALYLRQGQPVQVGGAPMDGMVRLYSKTEDAQVFLGVGEIDGDGLIAPRRLLADSGSG